MSDIISFFQKLIKGGVGIRAGGLENFSKLVSGGGRLFGTREYNRSLSRLRHRLRSVTCARTLTGKNKEALGKTNGLPSTSTSTSILSRTEYRYNAQSARNNKLINKKCWKMPLINDHSSDQIKKGLEI